MIKIGDKGDLVRELQKLLNIEITGIFDQNTDAKVREFQKKNALKDDGIVGNQTWGAFTYRYKDVTFDGYSYSHSPIVDNLKNSFSKEITSEYIPTIKTIIAPIGVKLLATIMAQQEGFYGATRSRRYNNPGNIGNTDNGSNKGFSTLKDGIEAQIKYIIGVGNGTNGAHKFGNRTIAPYYSQEIARNQKTYGIPPYLPGYKFNYQGQLGAFIKIYSTGARVGNGYLSKIISYFKENGYSISENTTIKEICNLK